MHYYIVIINLIDTLRDAGGEERLPGVDLQQALNEATIRFETLLRLYYLRHGCEGYDIVTVHYFSLLGFMHMKALGGAEPSEAAERWSTIALTFKGLRAQGRNFYLAQVVFRLLKDALGAEAQQLMREVADVTEENDESKSLIRQHVNSSWPVGLSVMTMDPEAQRLGNRVSDTM
jgi:hypothetical protein